MKLTNIGGHSFRGMAVKAPSRKIRNAQDAIEQWKVLKHPQYTNIFQEEEIVTKSDILENQSIMNQNYSFLDELMGNTDKVKFIEYFKQVTGFPSLLAISKKIIEGFSRVLKLSCFDIGKSSDDILLSGYDKFCSVGLDMAFPGSDLDKGYAVIKGINGDLDQQKRLSNMFKGAIWDNIDTEL